MGAEHNGALPGKGQPYVLVVDDDAAIREALEAVLEDEGYQVRCAANGRDALRLLQDGAGRPGLILLDLMMPVMSGWDFRVAQQRDPALAGIPVVILSADRDIGAKAAAIQVQAYLPKPVDIEVLIKTVERYRA